jgi:hypothetical protein
MCISAYTLGIKHGKSINKGNLPHNPIKAVVDTVKSIVADKETNTIDEGIQNIMAYDVDVAIDHIKKGR